MFGFGRRKKKREEAAAKAAAEEAAKKLAEEAAVADVEEEAEEPPAEPADSLAASTPEAAPTAAVEITDSEAAAEAPSETAQEEPVATEETVSREAPAVHAPVELIQESVVEEPSESSLTPTSEAAWVAPAAEAAVAQEPPQNEVIETAPQEPPETAQEEIVAEAAEPTSEDAPKEEDTETAPEPRQAAAEPAPEKKTGFFKRLKKSLTRTRSNFADGLANLVLGHKEIDDELLEELETMLLVADVGVEATTRIINELNGRVRRKELSDPNALSVALKTQLQDILEQCNKPVLQAAPGKPQVILMVGINGAGKTTTIGKLAKQLQEEGNSVMLAAGDTFRAAAVEQLQAWGERNKIPVIAQHTGADSASVIFDGLQAATARGVDVLIADTAGRLHTKGNLMDELAKIARVMQKIDPEAPHEVMLVVDATTGQNALNQALQFNETIPLTGITITKLDGTAKGGILFAIADKMDIPIRFIGVGEAIEDLRYFNAKDFVNALFEE